MEWNGRLRLAGGSLWQAVCVRLCISAGWRGCWSGAGPLSAIVEASIQVDPSRHRVPRSACIAICFHLCIPILARSRRRGSNFLSFRP